MPSSKSAVKKPAVLHVVKGALVQQNDREYVILRVADLNSVIAREVVSGE